MEMKSGYYTTAGKYKKINQDSLCILAAETILGEIVMAVVCDGMGGLKHGEIASAECIKGFMDWFNKELPNCISNGLEKNIIKYWSDLVNRINIRIRSYGFKETIELGTTVAAILILESKKFYGVNVGDSRIYKFDEGKLEQLTEDHSWIAREVKSGNMTWTEAKKDVRRNILLQCVGRTREISPNFFSGTLVGNGVFLLCSDGFWHEQENEDLKEKMKEISLNEDVEISEVLRKISIENTQRGEKDNITAVGIKICNRKGEK
ncbi:MAG: serine/threonine-protein phosphatase [Lachnospiraceae bacterium]|nr:serine/threonine-protein phosphatase [Lachnospiraceae bacterium]